MQILVGSVATPESAAAVDHAASEVRERGGTLHLVVHVPPPRNERDAEQHGSRLEAERRRLDRKVEAVRGDGVTVEGHFLQGPGRTSRYLVELAEELQVDAIVLGGRHRSAVGKLLLGSTANDVLLAANCPVTLVKAPTRP